MDITGITTNFRCLPLEVRSKIESGIVVELKVIHDHWDGMQEQAIFMKEYLEWKHIDEVSFAPEGNGKSAKKNQSAIYDAFLNAVKQYKENTNNIY